MHSLYANLLNETQKTLARKKTIMFLLLMFLLPVGAAGLLSKFQNMAGVSVVTLDTFQSLMLGLLTGILLPLMVFQLTGDLFAGEAGDKTMKAVLLRPISRFKAYTSKQLTIVLIVASCLLIAWIGSVLGGLLWMRTGISGPSLWAGFSLFAVSLLPLSALVTVGTLIAQFFKSGSGALAFCILLYIACKIATFVFPSLSTFLLTSYTDWYTWIGSSIAAGKALSACIYLLAFSMVSYTAGFVLFERKEF